jgi:hypothetical protein
MIFAGDSAPHHFQNLICLISHIFLRKNVFILNFQIRGQQLQQVLVDIVLSPKTLVCLAEQLWAGQAIGACLYTATNEAFAL